MAPKVEEEGARAHDGARPGQPGTARRSRAVVAEVEWGVPPVELGVLQVELGAQVEVEWGVDGRCNCQTRPYSRQFELWNIELTA